MAEQEAEPEPEEEIELVLTEVEMTVVNETEELVELEAATLEFEPEPQAEPESETRPSGRARRPHGKRTRLTSPSWKSSPTSSRSPRPSRPRSTARGCITSFQGGSLTLEDSVKDMLRPMLRQWLDENMPRMVTAALKDELDPNTFRQQD